MDSNQDKAKVLPYPSRITQWGQVPSIWIDTLKYVVAQINAGRGAIVPYALGSIGYFKPDACDKAFHVMLLNVSEMWVQLNTDRKENVEFYAEAFDHYD
jgi:hypothetical protein